MELAELKKLLSYNPDTGFFKRLVRTTNSVQVGDIAGAVNSEGYTRIGVFGKQYKVHRLACFYMTGKWPVQMDHINHIYTDNRWCNLRSVTHKENAVNRSLYSNNTSGVNGVYWSKYRNKWYSTIRIKGRLKYLGYFVDKFEAICTRMSADNKYGFHENHGR